MRAYRAIGYTWSMTSIILTLVLSASPQWLKCQDTYNAEMAAAANLGDAHCDSKREEIEVWRRAMTCFDANGGQPKHKEDWLSKREKALSDCKREHAQDDAAVDTARKNFEATRAGQNAYQAQVEKHDARMKELVGSPEVVSAMVCHARLVKKQYLAEIATEKKYSRLGGVQNNHKLLELQARIRMADDVMKNAKGKLQKCPSTPVLAQCYGSDDKCNQDVYAAAVEMEPAIEKLEPL